MTVRRHLAFLLLILSSAAFANGSTPVDGCPTLDIASAQQRAELKQFICYAIAQPGEAGYHATAPEQLPTELQWYGATRARLVFESSPAIHWVRIEVRNGSTERGLWYLQLQYPPLDEVSFWNIGESSTETLVTGDSLPFFSRVIDYRYFTLPVWLDAGQASSLMVRVKSTGSLNVPLSLLTPEQALVESNHATLQHGLFYGGLLIFAVFNLMLFGSSRVVSYLYNALYLLSLGMFLFAVDGLASRYLWPNNTLLANLFIPANMGISMLSMALFAHSFLEVQRGTLLDRLLLGMIVLSVILFAQVFVLPTNISIPINVAVGVSYMGILAVFAAVRWHQGYGPAKWYVMAGGCLYLGSMTYALASFDLLPTLLPAEIFLQPVVGQIAIGAQVLLLNHALVQRWHLVKQRLLDAEHRARMRLEQEVQARTAELNITLQELAQANERLVSMSVEDALTGLRNRRYLDDLLPRLCADARRSGLPLTVAIVDADHFKHINDRWGHDFGDQCLIHIARILERHAKRPKDAAIRFGGEEFALLLPDTDATGALSICDRVLKEARSSLLTAPDGATVRITLSAGLALLQPNEAPRELFLRADEALYRAKAGGRNQAVLGEPSSDG